MRQRSELLEFALVKEQDAAHILVPAFAVGAPDLGLHEAGELTMLAAVTAHEGGDGAPVRLAPQLAGARRAQLPTAQSNLVQAIDAVFRERDEAQGNLTHTALLPVQPNVSLRQHCAQKPPTVGSGFGSGSGPPYVP